MNVKKRYLKTKDWVLNPFFLFKQKWKLAKLNVKDRKLARKDRCKARIKNIGKFIYLKYAKVKNSKNYDEFTTYSLAMFLTWLVLWFVVVCYKYGKFTILLGAGIAVTISLAQYYLEWYHALRKKYRGTK